MPLEISHNALLNIAHTCSDVRVLGPGKRFAIWVQGCPFDCRGCIAPDWKIFKKASTISISNLAQTILNVQGLSGVTISGGEPFLQAGKLATLLSILKSSNPELDVVVFTGFLKEQLIWKEAVFLLRETDVLIDGNYVEKHNDGVGLKGSSNQEVHFITERLRGFEEIFIQNRPQMEVRHLPDGDLLIGIPVWNQQSRIKQKKPQ